MTEVFLITIDALRHDHFNQEYFPACWSYLNKFAIFNNAYSNGVSTPLSFPSIHTGYTIDSDGKLKEENPTLAELYDGYTFGISNNPHLRHDRGYHRGFDSFTGFTGEQNRPAESTISGLTSTMESQSGFFWIHLMDPHYPYYKPNVLEENLITRYSEREIEKMMDKVRVTGLRNMGLIKKDSDLTLPTEEDIEVCREMYGEIVRYVDRQLADFFNKLRESDRWEESLVIIMADHGEAFGEAGVFMHQWTANPIDPLIRVPLAVKYPYGKYSDISYEHSVQNADLLATMAEIFGWDVDSPPNTRPFTDPGYRPIISKSTTAVRVTTDSGYAISRGGSIVDENGYISDEAISILQSTSTPPTEMLADQEVLGLDEREKKELEERLKHLGYK